MDCWELREWRISWQQTAYVQGHQKSIIYVGLTSAGTCHGSRRWRVVSLPVIGTTRLVGQSKWAADRTPTSFADTAVAILRSNRPSRRSPYSQLTTSAWPWHRPRAKPEGAVLHAAACSSFFFHCYVHASPDYDRVLYYRIKDAGVEFWFYLKSTIINSDKNKTLWQCWVWMFENWKWYGEVCIMDHGCVTITNY